MRSIKFPAAGSIMLVAALVALSGAVAEPAQADPGTRSKLTPIAGGSGGGIVGITPTAHDVVGPGTFDGQGTLSVFGLSPNTDYKLLRYVDLTQDGVCTGTTALPLPGNPTLTTSDGGAGAMHFEISRGAPFIDGTRYDVLVRVVDLDGNAVLQSDCISATVK